MKMTTNKNKDNIYCEHSSPGIWTQGCGTMKSGKTSWNIWEVHEEMIFYDNNKNIKF